MKVLQVIHGYPMRYNAGSEIYTQTLCHALAGRHEIHVFTREEDPFAPDFRMRIERDPDHAEVTLHVVNNPRNRNRYREPGIDRRFVEVLDRIRPDVVHVGHLNHLSSALPFEAATRSIPVVHTLHDYWVMCPPRPVHADLSRRTLNTRGPRAAVRRTASAPSVATPATSGALRRNARRTSATGPVGPGDACATCGR